ncbi:eukaryotic translation initiation factor 4E-binding protein 3-like [Agrilus planipennis]|uniref:Eukaryotic translation initiation factor 4E-binding protein 3 n=1 Tax=Agrilus planipennis TaxID=224129 RepID=A0A1W4WG03_AGRPL|nr:eukaryotic translation initiation factor 4E-binding protein 3 [Agrilus planipennis]XP_025837079.1 eukaryotic translation initiation factor 4E-binding protein 3-like [Agrilus planipennis]
MSGSAFMRQLSESKPIPNRRDSESLDSTGSYSTTPGGSLYSTTPGGSKIVYDKSFLLTLRNSPLARTPPQYYLPDNVIKGSPHTKNGYNKAQKRTMFRRYSNQNSCEDHSEQFQLEI